MKKFRYTPEQIAFSAVAGVYLQTPSPVTGEQSGLP